MATRSKKKSTQQVDVGTQQAQDNDSKLNQVIEWVNSSDEMTFESRAIAEKSRDYYDSKQWTGEELSKLKQQKQAPTVINRIKPKIDGLMGMERSNRTTVKAFARTPKHAQGATAATEGVRYVLQNNFYPQRRSAAFDNMLIEGTGGVEIIVKTTKDDLRITINHIQWDRIIYDPHSRRKDFSDARYLGQVVWMDYDEAVDLYPQAKDILETMQDGSQTYADKPHWMDDKRRRVKICELYYYRGTDIYYCLFTRGGFIEEPKISPYMNEEGETQWPYEFASVFVDREGNRYGAVRQLLDVQDEINKRRSKALHLMSVRQTFGTEGSVPDVNEARKELAKPDGHLRIGFGEFGKDFGILPTNDMVAAQFNLLTEAKQEIDAVSYSAAAAGKDTRNMSGIALKSREMASQTELAPVFDVLKHLDIRVYRKVWNCIKQYWKEEKWIRVTDDENNLKWVGLNKPVTKGEQALATAEQQGVPPEMLQQLQQRIAQDPMMQEVVSTENDIVHLDVDITIADAPDTITQQVEDFQTLGEMIKSGFPMPPIAVIEASPLSNKDKIIKMMQESPQIPPQVQEQMEQAKEQMEQLQQQAQKLAQENQQLKADRSGEQMKLDFEAKTKQEELDTKRAALAEEFKLKEFAQNEELRLAREKARAELDLKRDIAMETAKLQSDKINSDREIAMQEKGIAADTDVMPVILEKIDNSFSALAQALDSLTQNGAQQIELQRQMLHVLMNPPPRSVSIGNISKQRDSNGELVGIAANVKPTVQ